MAKGTAAQREALKAMRREVLATMATLLPFRNMNLEPLATTPLGFLRTSAIQRHGVTRWKRGENGSLSVDCVDLHPALLENEWQPYGLFVLFHEFIHVLGFRAHNGEFRALEAVWPNASARSSGRSFTHAMRLQRSMWIWQCPSCEATFPRRVRGNRRYQCRTCRVPLLDVRREHAQ